MRATDPSWMKTSHTLTDHINTQASDSNGHLHKTQQHNARLFDLNRDKTHTYVFPLDSYNQISICSQDRRTSNSQDALPLKRCKTHDNIEDFACLLSSSFLNGQDVVLTTYQRRLPHVQDGLRRRMQHQLIPRLTFIASPHPLRRGFHRISFTLATASKQVAYRPAFPNQTNNNR